MPRRSSICARSSGLRFFASKGTMHQATRLDRANKPEVRGGAATTGSASARAKRVVSIERLAKSQAARLWIDEYGFTLTSEAPRKRSRQHPGWLWPKRGHPGGESCGAREPDRRRCPQIAGRNGGVGKDRRGGRHIAYRNRHRCPRCAE